MSKCPYCNSEIKIVANISKVDCKCPLEERTTKFEYVVFPYGDNRSYQQCILCGKKHNLKVF